MIVFDLECVNGHRFEGWFDSAEAFEEQNGSGMVSCPSCSDTQVRRILSPVAVKRSPVGSTGGAVPIDYRRLAREVVDYLKKNFDDVGPKFAAEALKIHYGVSEKRNIRGSATQEEEKSLKEEGIDFFKIEVPKIDEKEN